MDTLNQIVDLYLQNNGITVKCFAEYINCEYTKCAKWLKGERKLNSEQIKKTHEFLQGKFLKSVENIMNQE